MRIGAPHYRLIAERKERPDGRLRATREKSPIHIDNKAPVALAIQDPPAGKDKIWLVARGCGDFGGRILPDIGVRIGAVTKTRDTLHSLRHGPRPTPYSARKKPKDADPSGNCSHSHSPLPIPVACIPLDAAAHLKAMMKKRYTCLCPL